MIIQLKSSAKINLTLDVLGKDGSSGYHFVNSVMQEIPWIYDEIELEIDENSSDAVTVVSPFMGLSRQLQQNTIWQAVEIMRRETGHLENVYIKIKKNIPMQSGLGGGSSNASVIMKFLNTHWKLKKSRRFLAKLASEIGMDCVFFVYGGTAIASHFGEEIEPLPELKIMEDDLKIIFTGINVSTKEAYKSLHRRGQACLPPTMCNDCAQLINGIKNNESFKNLTKYFHNDFEEFVFQKSEFKKFFAENNLDQQNVRLCGSGGSVFIY